MLQLHPREGGCVGSRPLPRQTRSALHWLSVIGCAIVLSACGVGNGSSEVVQPSALVQSLTVSAQALPQPAEVIAGRMATFNGQAQGTGPLSYQWLRGSLPILGATAAEYSMRTLNADSGAALALQVTSTAASKLSQTAELTTKAIISPGATITAQRAVDKTNFIRADMVPQRLHGTEWNFIHTSGNWEPGRVSLFEGGAYKVENIRKSDDGSQVLHTVNAAAGDLLSDLMYEIGHPAIASC